MLAVVDAVVVSMNDGAPDNVTGVTLGSTRAGNYVDLDLGDGRYASYLHLQFGSVRVQAGDRVRRGQILERLGNSGNAVGEQSPLSPGHCPLAASVYEWH